MLVPMTFEQLILLGLGAVALALAIALRLLATRGSRRSKRRNRVAQRGETAAERLLERHGYEILERQVQAAWTFHVDGEPVEARVRADLLVQRRGQVYVAEVKTGDRAPDPSHPPTRRQLLEYRFAFDPDGLLLVDMSARRVHEVAFTT